MTRDRRADRRQAAERLRSGGALIADLHDLGLRDGAGVEVDARVHALGEQDARKPSFIERLRQAGLVPAAR